MEGHKSRKKATPSSKVKATSKVKRSRYQSYQHSKPINAAAYHWKKTIT